MGAGNGSAIEAALADPPVSLDELDESAHLVQFYEHDDFLVDGAARFLGTALGVGDAAVVIATQAHREAIEERLIAQGLSVAAARDQGRYVALDAVATLAELTADGWPEPSRFNETVGGAVVR
ncbi:MAG: MEDS domain-containing protein, partial [Candidatus Binatia bacterium]